MIWYNSQLDWQIHLRDAFFADRQMYPQLFDFQVTDFSEEDLSSLRRIIQ